jgi:hypothetical protein
MGRNCRKKKKHIIFGSEIKENLGIQDKGNCGTNCATIATF